MDAWAIVFKSSELLEEALSFYLKKLKTRQQITKDLRLLQAPPHKFVTENGDDVFA